MTCDLPAIEVTGDVVNLFVARRSRTIIEKNKSEYGRREGYVTLNLIADVV